jgi:hypothetical protein
MNIIRSIKFLSDHRFHVTIANIGLCLGIKGKTSYLWKKLRNTISFFPGLGIELQKLVFKLSV